jgi:hypothetical protein
MSSKKNIAVFETQPWGVILVDYISVLAYIIKELEKEAAECTDQKKMPCLYSLFPNPNCKWKHIVLNVKALVSNTRQRQTGSYQQSLERFHRVFDFSKFGYHR